MNKSDKEKSNKLSFCDCEKDHEHKHEHTCDCGYEHKHEHTCDCGHEHKYEHTCDCEKDHEHKHEHSCDCGHEHKHEHSCDCGHEHKHEHICDCGHEHKHEHTCDCGHEHTCDCGHEHKHEHTCDCGHEHNHMHGHSHTCACCDNTPIKIDKHQKVWQIDKPQLLCVIFSAIFLIVAICVERFVPQRYSWIALIIYLAAYLFVAGESFLEGFRGLKNKDFFNENTLMNVASIGAFCIGEYEEGVAVMLLYTIGEIIQGISVKKSKKSIGELLDIKVDYTTKVQDDDSVSQIATSQLNIGDKVLVKVGEKVPVDGIIIQGNSSFDYSKLTGESIPVELCEGQEVLGGTLNLNNTILVQVQKLEQDTTASKILKLVEQSQQNKPKAEKFVRKFAKIYTPIVFFVALAIAVFLPLLSSMTYPQSIAKALVFLVISCPCALVISTPLTYFGGIGSASRHGVLVKGGNYLEMLDEIDEVCFDKTGTLTQGKLEVVDIQSSNIELLKEVAGACESMSSHPIAKCISEFCGKGIVDSCQEVAGKGLICKYNQKVALCGNKKLLAEHNINITTDTPISQSMVYVAYDGEYLGYIAIADKLRESSKAIIQKLQNKGIRTVMLTGDNKNVAQDIAQSLGIDEFKAELLPQDKCDYVQKQVSQNKKVMFVGDGLNDAPAIKNASIGVCVGGIGNDASVEASDMVLIGGNIDKLDDAFAIAKKTKRIIKQNIALALGIKFLIMIICMFVNPIMWLAVVADVGVCLLAILNSMRTLKKSKPNVKKI